MRASALPSTQREANDPQYEENNCHDPKKVERKAQAEEE
jgi:hypothetical protein